MQHNMFCCTYRFRHCFLLYITHRSSDWRKGEGRPRAVSGHQNRRADRRLRY